MGIGTEEVRLPATALVVLIGVAGCGKSTFASRHWRETEVVSSDHCRALVADDPGDQGASADAFAVLHLIVEARLRRGLLTVVDATNVTAGARRRPLALARGRGTPPVAIVFDLPLDVCLRRNAGRSRRVDEDVVAQQYADLRASLPQLADEGFHTIHRFETPEQVDAAVVVREPFRRADRLPWAGPADMP